MRKSQYVKPNLAHLNIAKKVYVCSDCIRKGTHDIWLLERPKGATNEEWLAMSNEVDKHKEEAHGSE